MRVGWPSGDPDGDPVIVAVRHPFADGRVQLELRVGKGSHLIVENGPLYPPPDRSKSEQPTQRDRGIIKLGDSLHPDLPEWIEVAHENFTKTQTGRSV